MAVPDPSLAALLERSARLRAQSDALVGETVAQGYWCAALRARSEALGRCALALHDETALAPDRWGNLLAPKK